MKISPADSNCKGSTNNIDSANSDNNNQDCAELPSIYIKQKWKNLNWVLFA